jgi:hypothetical protein
MQTHFWEVLFYENAESADEVLVWKIPVVSGSGQFQNELRNQKGLLGISCLWQGYLFQKNGGLPLFWSLPVLPKARGQAKISVVKELADTFWIGFESIQNKKYASIGGVF